MADTCPCPKFFAGDYGDGVVSQPEWPDYEFAADNITDVSVWAEYSEAAHDALQPCFVDGFTNVDLIRAAADTIALRNGVEGQRAYVLSMCVYGLMLVLRLSAHTADLDRRSTDADIKKVRNKVIGAWSGMHGFLA